MENELTNKNNPSLPLRELTVWNLSFAFLLALMSGFFIVLFFTSLVSFISRELWSVQIEWPIIIYFGGIIGGAIGGFVTFLEIRLVQLGNKKFMPAKLLTNDLFYIGGLAFLTYVLETLSESLLLQGVLFILEIGWFIILGWNVSKMSLESIK